MARRPGGPEPAARRREVQTDSASTTRLGSSAACRPKRTCQISPPVPSPPVPYPPVPLPPVPLPDASAASGSTSRKQARTGPATASACHRPNCAASTDTASGEAVKWRWWPVSAASQAWAAGSAARPRPSRPWPSRTWVYFRSCLGRSCLARAQGVQRGSGGRVDQVVQCGGEDRDAAGRLGGGQRRGRRRGQQAGPGGIRSGEHRTPEGPRSVGDDRQDAAAADQIGGELGHGDQVGDRGAVGGALAVQVVQDRERGVGVCLQQRDLPGGTAHGPRGVGDLVADELG